MKDYVVPYVVGMHGEWWAGIDIYNHNADKHAVVVSIYRHSNGGLASSFDVEIDPYCHHLILPDVINKHIKRTEACQGRATVTVRGPDNLMITPFQASDKGFGILPVFEATTIKN